MTASESIDLKSVLNGDMTQLRRLLHVTLGDPEQAAGNGRPSDSLLAVLTALQRAPLPKPAWNAAQLIDTLRSQQLAPDSRTLETIRFSDAVMTQLLRHSLLDESIRAQLQRLYVPLVKSLLLDEAQFIEARGALPRLIDSVCESAAGWFGALGRGGEPYLLQLADTVEQVLQRFETDEHALPVVVSAFADSIVRENERVVRLEKRVCETEMGALRARRAQTLVTDLFNEKIAGKILPKGVVDLLRTVFLEQIRLFLIQEGPQAELWKRWQKLTETLVWSLQPKTQAADKQKLYSLIPTISAELEKSMQAIERQRGALAPLLAAIELAHIDVMKGQLSNAVAVEPLDAGFGIAGVRTAVSRSLIEQAETYTEGQWFLYKNEQEQVVRCKLALKLPDMDQLLFVNRMGQKVMQKGIEDFAYCLSAKLARPLNDKPLYQRIAQKVMQDLVSQFAERERASREVELKQRQQARAAAEKIEREKAEREAEDKKRVAAAAKARAEADALAAAREQSERDAAQQAQAVAQAEARVRAEQDALHREDRVRMAKLQLDSLGLGAWVRLPGASGELVHGKLAVKMRSSGRFIFVDRIGIKVAEYLRDDLIAMLVERRADIVEQNDQFEDRLAKIVGSMRRDD